MNYKQRNTTEITHQSANKLICLLGGAERNDHQEDEKKHQPAQKPERTSEEKRLESLGYIF